MVIEGGKRLYKKKDRKGQRSREQNQELDLDFGTDLTLFKLKSSDQIRVKGKGQLGKLECPGIGRDHNYSRTEEEEWVFLIYEFYIRTRRIRGKKSVRGLLKRADRRIR